MNVLDATVETLKMVIVPTEKFIYFQISSGAIPPIPTSPKPKLKMLSSDSPTPGPVKAIPRQKC